MKRIAIYPGSFDPITNGHLDIVLRASKLFDKTIIAVAYHNDKGSTLFNFQERTELCKKSIESAKNIEVTHFKGLVVDLAKNINACTIIRGLRAVSDFEYELQLALMNRKLYDKVETIFFTPKNEYLYLSSSLIKQVAKLGGNICEYVPEPVKIALDKKIS